MDILLYSLLKQPLQSNVQNLVNFLFFLKKKKLTPSRPRVGFPFLPDPNFLRKSVTLIRKYYHVSISVSTTFGPLASTAKGQEAVFLIFCNMIGKNRQPLDLHPYYKTALRHVHLGNNKVGLLRCCTNLRQIVIGESLEEYGPLVREPSGSLFSKSSSVEGLPRS